MKKLIITGAGSYIGTFVAEYFAQNFPDEFEIETVDMIDPNWKSRDFSGADVVFHVAGLAHSDVGNVSDEVKAKYYKVNTDLTVETAEKAKAEGVGQFIFMSSAIVYGDSAAIGKKKHITKETVPTPANFYGDSKLKAEEGITPLGCESFRVAILRPPMIYGRGSKGNYPILSKLARKLPIFPKVQNGRSMLYVGNLAEFLRLIILNGESGIFCPQNAEYTNTCEMVKLIGEAHGKKVRLIGGFGWALKILSKVTGLVNKAFGNLTYDKALSDYADNSWQKYSLQESIKETEA